MKMFTFKATYFFDDIPAITIYFQSTDIQFAHVWAGKLIDDDDRCSGLVVQRISKKQMTCEGGRYHGIRNVRTGKLMRMI